jgi:hypothetical protein
MSRSRRKTPIVGHTNCRSERDDKKRWHRRWRARERETLASAPTDSLGEHLPLLEKQVSNVWAMGKDGRAYWSNDQRLLIAKRVAQRRGRNVHERLSLKTRLLRKWKSK